MYAYHREWGIVGYKDPKMDRWTGVEGFSQADEGGDY